MKFKEYKRKGLSEMITVIEFTDNGGNLSKVSISEPDKALLPETFMQGMVARNPKNHLDLWYVSKKYFDDNLELVTKPELSSKTLTNTTASQAKDNVSDILFWGDGDMWKLLGKASSKNEGWMKSSKAMEIDGLGCVVQVTTQNKDNVAEATVFVPKCTIEETKDIEGKVVSRKLKIVH